MSSTWDEAAPAFDDEPYHGLRDPQVRAAWTALLQTCLPAAPASILDVGCGTGSLSVLLAELGYIVTGIDSSSAMLGLAAAKAAAAGVPVSFRLMDAAEPHLTPHQFAAVICRHVLWALPNQTQVLQHWMKLLQPHGRLVLIQGFWHTGAGLIARDLEAALPPGLTLAARLNLSAQPELWGRVVTDERYALLADLV